MLAASDAHATSHATVPENANITLTLDIIADPAPTATWHLNGGGLPTMTITSLK